jgi:hypothetical protein
MGGYGGIRGKEEHEWHRNKEKGVIIIPKGF